MRPMTDGDARGPTCRWPLRRVRRGSIALYRIVTIWHHPAAVQIQPGGRASVSGRMKTLVVFACLIGVPTTGFGQAAIAGSVKDSSGAPMTGVMVEASSPALIERIRTAVTDGAGRYRIEDLRPGTYQVRFTLAGWRPQQREGVELTGSFTATVNAELTLGALTEVVTVTGESPRRRRTQREARGDAQQRRRASRFPRSAATTRCSVWSRASSPT